MLIVFAPPQVNMNSVERMLEYAAYQPEAPAILEGHRPLPGWPQQGAIDVQQLVVRYRPDLDPVLKGLTFSVRGREKVRARRPKGQQHAVWQAVFWGARRAGPARG